MVPLLDNGEGDAGFVVYLQVETCLMMMKDSDNYYDDTNDIDNDVTLPGGWREAHAEEQDQTVPR